MGELADRDVGAVREMFPQAVCQTLLKRFVCHITSYAVLAVWEITVTRIIVWALLYHRMEIYARKNLGNFAFRLYFAILENDFRSFLLTNVN